MVSERSGVRSACAAVLSLALSILSVECSYARETSDLPSSAEVLAAINRCAAGGGEIVLFANFSVCKDYGDGQGFLKKEAPDVPRNVDFNEVCKDPKDLRRLPADAIKRVAAQEPKPGASGIRILGAVFCETLDLIGLDVPYSIVIDSSVFRKGIEARNFHTHADLSFDNGVIAADFRLARSRVDGSVFASDAVIAKLQVLDSEVHGSLIFREDALLGPAIFDTVGLSGELSVRQSTFSYFLLQFSKVGGVLDITDSGAKCAYNIRTNEIGDFVAVGAGFNTRRHRTDHPDNGAVRPEDADAILSRLVDRIRDQGSTPEIHQSGLCNYVSIAPADSRAFLVSDTRIRSSLCVRALAWNESWFDGPPVVLSFKDLNVATTTFIDLRGHMVSGDSSFASQFVSGDRFEMFGLETNSLIFDFGGGSPTYASYINGLKFGHVYRVPDNKCEYDPDIAKPTDQRDHPSVSAGYLSSELRFPPLEDVTAWLNRNFVQTTQPFSAFIDAYSKDGEDDAAKRLRIEKSTTELCTRALRTVYQALIPFCQRFARQSVSSGAGNQPATFLQRANDWVVTAFGLLLWLLADHGYRPEKVGWAVLITLFLSVCFVLSVQVVAIKPAKKNIIRPMGLAFLFDRLLPAYRIREDHYDIECFYKRAARARRQARYRSGPLEVDYLEYFRLKIPVVKADEVDVRRVEVFLDVLKVIGIVLAIFLVAAINALVNH